ncbi:Probable histone-lysine N-methyltransferase Mes-4 [Eumeta japonica]|uniref:Probable histone-lysine N-methyltransferase Mes-4 n=1 Tax=Eumeta variegata TaxID=151549 RepID=A0A4C1SXP4_EUMVA|nr:Probable histone-lysine N-methyltransferase Mes-4 [Eumeta japonica]
MYISVNSGAGSDIESYYGSNDNICNLSLAAAMKNKRERSISPYSPAYSPIKSVATKRRKLSGDQDSVPSSSRRALHLAASNSEENLSSAAISLSQTNSIGSTDSNTHSMHDLDLYNSLEFRKLYAYMKDYVMEQNHDMRI